MIKIRDIESELYNFPRPNRRRVEELIRLVYLKGKEDQKREVQKMNKYTKLFQEYKRVLLYNKELELLIPPPRRQRIKSLR